LLIEQTTDVDEVFRLMEQSRARSLQDRLSSRPDLRTFARSLPAGTAVLEYWLGSSSDAVLWISASGSGMKRRQLTTKDREAIAELPSVFADPRRKDWREAARGVSQDLLADIPPLQNTGIRNIVIIPDGALARLPFEALPFGGSGLLIERFTVSYSPS